MIEQYIIYYLYVGLIVAIPLSFSLYTLESIFIFNNKPNYIELLRLYILSVLLYPYIIIQLLRVK